MRRSLSNQELREQCKLGEKQDCCRYVLCDGEGFHCAKDDTDLVDIKNAIDHRVEQNLMVATAINCK